MSRLLRIYRSTEGFVTTLSLYVALCVGITAVWPAVTTGPTSIGVLAAVLALVVGGTGLYLYAEAMQRLFDAITERFETLISQVMNA